MALITIPFTFSAGAVIIASQHNSNFTTISSDYNGNIENVNISATAAIAYSKLNLATSIVNADVSTSAAIVDTKLATISTAGKVNISALTVASQSRGDIIYASGTTTWSRLGAGTSGQALLTQGANANPIWGSAPAFIFVSNTTVTTAANTGNIAITDGNYYKIVFHLGTLSGDDVIWLRFNDDSSGGDYDYGFGGRTSGGAITGGAAGADQIVLGTSMDSGTNRYMEGEFMIYPRDTGFARTRGQVCYIDAAGALITFVDFGAQYGGGAPTSFKILTAGGATMSGHVLLYRLATS